MYDGIYAILLLKQSKVIFNPLRRRKMATAKKFSTVVNGVMVDDLMDTINAVKATPAIAKFKFSVQNQWHGGSQNCTTASGFYGATENHSHPKPFVLQADEPAVLLGKDTAANPVQHLLHALASCLTTSMVYHAAARGIQIDKVESTFEGDLDLRGFLELDPSVRKGYQGIRARFKVSANVPDDQLEEIIRLGTGHSPVYDSLANGVPIAVSAERA